MIGNEDAEPGSGEIGGGPEIDALVQAWKKAEGVVVLTGAGLSTASGIPDFRSPGGRWENYQPVTIQEFENSQASREEYWSYKGETWEVIAEAEPNPAHRALADLANGGYLRLLVTQNVDGLHERSGFPADRLINIHGTDSMVECLECGERLPRQPIQEEWQSGMAAPTCPCGGYWKPATISFGQTLVMNDLRRAFEESEGCGLFVAIGTSLVVSPINQMFAFAHQSGASTAILTASETPYDAYADHRSSAAVERLLPRIAAAVLA